MEAFTICVIFSLFLHGNDALDIGDSPVTCSTAGVLCNYNETSLIDQVTHVYSLKECRQLCMDDADCKFISYLDEQAVPFSHLCQMFKSCESVAQNSNGITENIKCFETCGSNIVGDLDENILIVTPNVETEVTCKQMCIQNDGCSFYTYYFDTDPYYHQYCVLLSEFLRPTEECYTCVTGTPECTNPCSLQLNEEFHRGIMFTDTTDTQYVTVNGFGSAACEIRILAVGGGGKDGGNAGAISLFQIESWNRD